MGFTHRTYLGGNKIYACAVCRTHMATIESMMSRRFNGQHGQAFLFESVFNIIEADPEDRQMTTGLHRVRDIRCAKCGQTMGWKYEKAYETSQKYKEGKSILEKALLVECASPALISPSTSPENGNLMLMSSSDESASPPSSSSVPTSMLINMEAFNSARAARMAAAAGATATSQQPQQSPRQSAASQEYNQSLQQSQLALQALAQRRQQEYMQAAAQPRRAQRRSISIESEEEEE